MKRVLVKNGEVVRVLDLGKKLKEAKESLRKQRISESLKARNKERREYKDKLIQLKSHWRGTAK
jgi:hypothetical protein